MDIHQCPRCELRFVHTSELRHHFEHDHAADPAVFERYRYRSSPASERPTILLVGNQTLDRDEVIAEVARRAAESGARVLVLAPATAADPGADGRTGRSLARWRADVAVERLRAAGVGDVEGHAGGDDPFGAVCELLAAEHVDEIVLSTLPPASSRWLGADLPGRLRRYTRPALTVLTPSPIGSAASTEVTG
jgi:hypothetical protein